MIKLRGLIDDKVRWRRAGLALPVKPTNAALQAALRELDLPPVRTQDKVVLP